MAILGGVLKDLKAVNEYLALLQGSVDAAEKAVREARARLDEENFSGPMTGTAGAAEGRPRTPPLTGTDAAGSGIPPVRALAEARKCARKRRNSIKTQVGILMKLLLGHLDKGYHVIASEVDKVLRSSIQPCPQTPHPQQLHDQEASPGAEAVPSRPSPTSVLSAQASPCHGFDKSESRVTPEGPREHKEGSRAAIWLTPRAPGAFSVPEELLREVKELTEVATKEASKLPPVEDIHTYGASAWLVPVRRRLEVVQKCNRCLSCVGLELLPEPRIEEEPATPLNVLKLCMTPLGREELVRDTVLQSLLSNALPV